MTPISALAILFCIYAVSELIAQKTKAIFSTVLSIAILLLAGFWSGILPRTLIDNAQITGFGNIIAGLLIVSLGTTIDFAELRRQWKVVVTALCGVCGAVAAIVLIGRPFIGSEMAIAGAPIFAGGSAATLIMTSTLKEMNLTTAATFCIVLYVTQKFIGVPIASLMLRRTARLIRDDAVLVEQYSTLQEENAATHHGPLHLPKCCERPSMYLAKLAVVAVIAYYASKLTGGAVHYFVMCLIMGAVFFALGFLDKSILGKTQATPEQVLSVLPALLTAAACGVFGTMAAALLCAKLLRIPISLAAAYGISCTFGFPTTMLIPQEVSEAFGRNEKEKKAILNFLLPKMLTAGFVTVTIVSVLIAGAAVKML